MTHPTHNRLMAALKAAGPYLREKKCQEASYFFDCLSVCVDDKPSPELREFWGWWMVMETTEQGYVAKYAFGQYNVDGDWVDLTIPESAKKEVVATLESFHQKLTDLLNEKYQLTVEYHLESAFK